MVHTAGLTCQRFPKWYFGGPRWRFCMFPPAFTLQYTLNPIFKVTPYMNLEKHQNVVYPSQRILPEICLERFIRLPRIFPESETQFKLNALIPGSSHYKIEHTRTKIGATRWEATQGVTATKLIIPTQTIAILWHPMAHAGFSSTGYCENFWLRHRV